MPRSRTRTARWVIRSASGLELGLNTPSALVSTRNTPAKETSCSTVAASTGEGDVVLDGGGVRNGHVPVVDRLRPARHHAEPAPEARGGVGVRAVHTERSRRAASGVEGRGRGGAGGAEV